MLLAPGRLTHQELLAIVLASINSLTYVISNVDNI